MKSRIAALALAAAVSFGLAGCNLVAPQDTTIKYDPSDGVSAEVGQIGVRNALIVTTDGALGNLVLTVTNRGTEAVDLTVQYKDASGARKDLVITAAPGVTPFGFGDHGQILLDSLDTIPGGLVDVFFHYGTETGQQVAVPVMAPCLEEYADLLPKFSSVPAEPQAPVEGDAVVDAAADEAAAAAALAELDAAHAELAALLCEMPEPIDRGGHH